MNFTLLTVLSATGVFVGMLGLFEVGRRLGLARFARDQDGADKGSGPIEATVFGLLGLLIAFTFSGAASRFESRRHLITEEANAIGTAYLRIDLLPKETQPDIRERFRRYLDARLAIYSDLSDRAVTNAARTETLKLQDEIWAHSVTACQRPESPSSAAMLLLPALNAMIDITTTRFVALQNHPPLIIILLLVGLSLLCALLAGNVLCGAKGRSWLYMLLYAATMSLTLYVILDLEYPRFGLIRIDSADQTLMELRELMR